VHATDANNCSITGTPPPSHSLPNKHYTQRLYGEMLPHNTATGGTGAELYFDGVLPPGTPRMLLVPSLCQQMPQPQFVGKHHHHYRS
jgi:hypothetical protein